jgi:uncharacterized protein (UPF0276 family)
MGTAMSSLKDRLSNRVSCGIGLRADHVAEVMATRPAVAWFEVHAENYMGGGRAIARLERVRRDWPVSLHGVGLSLGGADRPDRRHLDRLKALARRIEPCLVSEHLAWSGYAGTYLNDLLPLPYTEQSLAAVARNVTDVQDALGRRILVENPSSYLRFASSAIPEAEFLSALAQRTGCGLLCDVNNVFVSCSNLGGDPVAWLDALPARHVGELHLAGHTVNDCGGPVVLIDDHGSPVAEPVWSLYEHAAARFPQAPALIEWDSRLPPLATLVAEAALADQRRTAMMRSLSHDAA